MTTTAPRPRRQYAKTAARREQILQAAVDVFSSASFHEATLRQIADRIGMTDAGVLHHFASKEALYEAVIRWRDDESRKWLQDSAPRGIEFLRALVGLTEFSMHAPALLELHLRLSVESLAPDHPMHRYSLERHHRAVERLKTAFIEADADGHLRSGVDAQLAADSLWGLIDGLHIQWLRQPDQVDVLASIRQYLQSMLQVEL